MCDVKQVICFLAVVILLFQLFCSGSVERFSVYVAAKRFSVFVAAVS